MGGVDQKWSRQTDVFSLVIGRGLYYHRRTLRNGRVPAQKTKKGGDEAEWTIDGRSTCADEPAVGCPDFTPA